MPARWLQQKKAKQKRMRRAWAKPLSMKSSGPMKHPMYVNEKGDVTDLTVKARAQVAQNVWDAHLLARYKFHPNSNEAIYARYRGLHTDLTPDREIILAKLVQSRSGAGTIQGEQRFVCQILIERENRQLKLYMGGETNFFIEFRITDEGSFFLRSVEYNDRKRAFDAYLKDNILWDEITPHKAD